MKHLQPTAAVTKLASDVRMYRVDRRCIGDRSAMDVVTALIRIHRP